MTLYVVRKIRDFLATFEPLDLYTFVFEDIVHGLLQLGCSAYAGRVLLSRAGLLPQEEYPLDFGSGAGLALHVATGLFTWGAWSGMCEAAQALQDDFAKWRWSPEGVRQS